MDDHAQRPAGSNRDRRLQVQVLLDDPLAGLVGGLLGGFADGLDEVVFVAAEGHLPAHAEKRRQCDALEEAPGVVVDLVLQAGIPCRIGCRQVVDENRTAVRHDDPLPDQEGPSLAEGDDAVIGADQPRSLRDEELRPVRCHRRSPYLGGHQPGEVRVDPSQQARRYHRSRHHLVGRDGILDRIRVVVGAVGLLVGKSSLCCWCFGRGAG